MAEFLWPIRVYIEDTDAGGIVYYVNYLKFMERARTEWLRSLGFDKAGANSESYQFVVREANVRYLSPARLDDELQVRTSLEQVGGASLTLAQEVIRDAQCLARAAIVVACVQGASLKPCRLPAKMLEQLA